MEIKDKENPMLSYKQLEIVRGCLCHMSMAYEIISPFLKCFHLLLCRHLPKWDSQGWKVPEYEYKAYVNQMGAGGEITDDEFSELLSPKHYHGGKVPKEVVPVDRFKTDVKFLRSIFNSKVPREVCVRIRRVHH